MKYSILPVCLCVLSAFGQGVSPATPQATPTARPSVAPDTVVLKVAGKPLTAAEFERIAAGFSPEIQQAAMKNPQQVLQSYFLMQELTRRAEAAKLDQSSPVKEQLELQRMQTLATAEINKQQAAINVSGEDSRARYDTDRDKKYQQAKIRAIFIQFADPKALNAQVDLSDPKNPKPSVPKGQRVEAEAKSMAEDIVKQARAGGDFAELAKSKSDDKKTGANGGEYPMIHGTDRIADELKKAIFALKPGDIGDPVRAPNGFYVFKMVEKSIQPFDEVKQVAENDVKTERFQKWMADQQKQFEVSVENPSFFGAPSLKTPAGAASKATPSASK